MYTSLANGFVSVYQLRRCTYSVSNVCVRQICAGPRIGATTVGTGGELVPQLLGWGNVLVPHSPNFLAVVFNKQEISRQVVTMQDLPSEFSKKIFRG